MRDAAQLMAQIASGNSDAFNECYDRFHARAFRVARSVCHDHDLAEEAVQDAFTGLWRNRATYQPDRGSVEPWLMSLVRYRAIDVARANNKHAFRRAGEEEADTRLAPGDLTDVVIADADAASLHLRLGGLPELQREVIMLAYFGELSHSEIATKLSLAPGTVKGRMRLGMHKLRAAASA